jgi:phosphoribosylaminoimidazolecarboxamide formyltransferase/IMP cyclohydrolase
MTDGRIAVKRALISVSDKTDLLGLGHGLYQYGVEIISTGGTARTLRDAGIPVIDVEQVTGFPEILGGRVKSMHPLIAGGMLADPSDPVHATELKQHNITPIQLVICNLYPFKKTVDSGADADECVENIDIGGPTMLRAAAKNFGAVAVVTNPELYADVLESVFMGGFTLAQRTRLMVQAFQHTAEYDIAVATWAGQELTPEDSDDGFPTWRADVHVLADVLGYGENPHQKAARYVTLDASGGIANARKLGGKPMSRNNNWDSNAAWRAVSSFTDTAVVIIKHATPCGIALGANVAEAHRKANACDPISAFGGVIAANRPVSVEMAKQVVKIFTEVLIAPGYEDGALEILATKPNLRVLEVTASPTGLLEFQPIDGGLLVQTPDIKQPGDDPRNWTLVAGKPVDEVLFPELGFAWDAVHWVKSNGILLAADGSSVGIGTGQPNRVDSCRDAVRRAGREARGSFAASDAFFPYDDGPQVLIDAGVAAIIEPGGSNKDDETIALCQKYSVALYFTGVRHFLH